MRLGRGCYSTDISKLFYFFNNSSKIYAMANAGGHLRSNESSCAHDILFGLNSYTTGCS